MREPIIVEADDGFHFIATRSFAEISLEAIDIENGIYTVYDADGLKLDLAPAPNGAGVISSPPMPQDCSAQLIPKLREFLDRIGIPDPAVSGRSFQELVQLGVDRVLEREAEPFATRLWAALRRLVNPRHTA